LLATTELASSNRSRSDHSNGGDANKKTLYYTPWNGRFFVWYKGHLLVFRHQFKASDFSSREEVSISYFGRSLQILRELLSEYNTEYTKLVQDKTYIYKYQEGTWARSEVADRRRIKTVVLNESKKVELLKHIGDFLNPISRKWYSNRRIPYRMGYLLYSPPGTGKSSLSKSITGYFGLDIYILSLSDTNEARLKNLFAELPSRCIILLEDIDAVSSNRSGDTETEDSRQTATSSPSQGSKSVGGNISLSTLLNVIDGIALKEGRVLIMTTNHIICLDGVLIRPGRIDKKVELGLANKSITADLFCLVFKPAAGESDILVGEDGKVPEAARSQEAEVKRVEGLAEAFATKVPELEFSPAGVLSFLLDYRQSPEEAIDNVE
jgi:mitochondrial chaperone BCS1